MKARGEGDDRGSGRQEGLACSGPWSHEESDMTKRLNNNNNSEADCKWALQFSFVYVEILLHLILDKRLRTKAISINWMVC